MRAFYPFSNGDSLSWYRWQMVSRVLAAIVVGFLVANAICIFLALMLSSFLPIAKISLVVWLLLLAFLVWTLIIMWVFHQRSLTRIWGNLIVILVSLSTVSAVFIYMDVGL